MLASPHEDKDPLLQRSVRKTRTDSLQKEAFDETMEADEDGV